MNKLVMALTDKNYRTGILAQKGMKCRWLSDEEFTRRQWRLKFGREINLDDPQTYNEKLQWLKLYYHNPAYVPLVDKYEAKKIVADKIGEQYIVPTLGVWDRFDDIDFDILPNQFVLKCTHDSGGLVIVRDKSKLDKNAAKKKIEKCLRTNFYWHGREWQYKDIKPRIIAEEYLTDSENDQELTDYKFFCFDGEPKFLYVSEGLENHETARISFVTLNWTPAPFQRTDFCTFEKLPDRPEFLKEMIEVSRALSKGIPFVRVDLYQVKKKILFSELTFTPCGGYMSFDKMENEFLVGDMIHLPQMTTTEK